MCWKVLTLKLCFVINPVCGYVWMVVKLCHAPNLDGSVGLNACVQGCNVFVCAKQWRVRELTHALTCPDWARSDWEWCPHLRYWWFHPLRQQQAVSLSLPKLSCPSLFLLGFSWKTQAVWSLNMAVVGWVYCYPPLAFSDSSPSYDPSPMHGEKKSQSETGSDFLRISKTHCCVWGQLEEGAPTCLHI